MKYLVLSIPSEDYAKAISKFLYGLSIPDFRFGDYYFCGWIKHPENNHFALIFTNDNLPIHKDANAKILVDQIRQAITLDEATEMENIINANLGQKIKPIDFIPASVGDNILTHQEAESQGWFSQKDI